ncbi:MAG: glycosyltransferase [Candidatus Electrothrix aestuarii]|uniref:Glycosyltransferase n=1 Tax=Candidatus Electrothrix aestuarii TaxID=3062594 RepID=A0AAU8LTC2_9BACT|nr:glycosyltransferase [Candidatus Electrothrix aestuarii]
MNRITNKKTGILYISYDGILEPLGQSQVLSYLERLAARHNIILISFEKSSDWKHTGKRDAVCRRIQAAGIEWVPLRYHKRFSVLATLFDITQGIMVGGWLTARYRIQIIHARSYVSSVIALVLKKMFGVKYIFDMRGFWADERVDGGIWPSNSRIYYIAKWFEQHFLLSADYVVSLTHSALSEIKTFPYLQGRMPRFEVITTCADLELFKATTNIIEKRERSFVLGYVGSVGTWYLFDEVLRFFKILHKQVPGAVLHILNRGDHDYILERISVAGLSPDLFQLNAADHTEVVQVMQKMDAGIFFYKPTYSKLATAPTKLGEFLGCGVPCISNAGVGDIQEILQGEQVGVALNNFSDKELDAGLKSLFELTRQPDIQQRCRQAAGNYFSLENGVAAYDRIYNELAS